jgi:hypothetical protein
MRELAAWWGHLPVFIGTLYKVKEHRDWYKSNLQAALEKTPPEHSQVLRAIPTNGFYVKFYSGFESTDVVASGFQLLEDLEQFTSPQSIPVTSIAFGTVYYSPSILGTADNPLLDLFPKAILGLPKHWEFYLSWRRRCHWKPVPEWLVKLRTEERKEKQRKRTRENPCQRS